MLDQRPSYFRIATRAVWGGALLLLFFGAGLSDTARAQLVNGSFEQPVVPRSASTETVRPGQPAAKVPGWQTDSPDGTLGIRRSESNGVAAYQGEQFLEIKPIPPENVYQDIPTVPGRTYRWAFAYRARAGAGELLMLIDDRVGVSRLHGKPDGWTYVEGTHIAVGTVTRLEFRPARGTRAASFVDGVTFEAQIKAGD